MEQDFTVLNYGVYFWSDTELYSKYVHLAHRLHSDYHCGEGFNVYKHLLSCFQCFVWSDSGNGNHAYLAVLCRVQTVISGIE